MNACLPPPLYWPCHLRYYWWMTALTQCTHPRSLHHWGRYVGDVTRHAPPPRASTPRTLVHPLPTRRVGRRTVGWRGTPTQVTVVEEWKRSFARSLGELPLKGKGDLDWFNQVEWFELRVIPRKKSGTQSLIYCVGCKFVTYLSIPIIKYKPVIILLFNSINHKTNKINYKSFIFFKTFGFLQTRHLYIIKTQA